MKFGNPKVLNDALASLNIFPDPSEPIPINSSLQPVIMVASSAPSIGNVGISKTDILTRTPVNKCMQQTALANTLYTLYTPTAGKIGYITDMFISSSSDAQIRAGDNISGNTFTSGSTYDNCVSVNTAVETAHIHFSVPLRIVTALKYEADGGTGVSISCHGWEE